MNQVEGTGTQDRVALEKDQIAGSHQVHTSSLASWHTQWENQSLKENGVLSSAGENHSQEVEQRTLKTADNGTNVASYLSTPSSGAPNAQNYSGYASYSNSNSYASSSTGYASYYNQYQQASPYEQQPNQYQQQTNQYQQQTNQYHNQPNLYQQPANQYQQQTNQYQQPANQYPQQTTQYQQQPNQYPQQSNPSYSNQVGAYQNTGVPYQPISSFQNTGSYSGSASYSSTYYNPGDYQTPGSYTSGTYSTQTNPWHESQYAAYGTHQYPTYTPDSTAAYSSSPAAANIQYQQQHYKQWDDYYRQTQTEVSCAPGTEHLSASSASSVNYSFPAASTGYTASTNQMPAGHTPGGPQFSSAGLNSFQSVAANGGILEDHQKHAASVSQNPLRPPEVPPHEVPNLQNLSYPTSYQFSQGHHLSFPTVPQPPEPLDSHRASKLQIPTNPRIVSNLPLVSSKSEKSSLTGTAAAKPAYTSVSLQKPGEADFMLKPGSFPKSLRGYVERALARCKNDRQKILCQDIMKEVITKATADGTLHTKDWDSEPLFALPDPDIVNKQNTTFQLPISMPKSRSPKRAKSRWEPISEGKGVDKSNNISSQNAKYVGWNSKQFLGEKPEHEYNSGANVSSADLKISTKNVFRPAKRQRFVNAHAHSDAETSSDSEDRSLTKYSLAATALADSPEEKKRRESRTKRFDKKHGNRIENSNIKAKVFRAGNLYARQVGSLGLARTSEESASRAVEDIDWDAFTVKGTCQEIEKRYLRLTSAPDPAMVRPEEVLEKALAMVQNSPKNYLYKCDQLKSIRQDLTVQHIRNELTAKVYETHARLAIEVGDLPEYNQCQSQLKTLYGEGIMGCHMEFAAYNLLLVILHSNNNRDLLSAMSRLSSDAKKDEAVQHALSVRAAVTSGNYVMFFRLHKTAPNLNSLFMDLYVEKMRYAAIKCICRSYRPTVPVSYLSQILGFNNTSEASDEKEVECMEWLKAHGAVVTSENPGETLLDTKASIQSLYIPEPEDAVAHGDANLAVNDFLTRSLA